MTVDEKIKKAKEKKSSKLDLCDRKLNEFPIQITELSDLRELDLSKNQLMSLPAEIGKLTNLTWLFLGGNQLMSLPTEIGKLTNLTLLYLGGNQLTSLPLEIGKLTNLTWLFLNGNHLTVLPADIVQLTNLDYLFLNGNQLTVLPADIGKLTNLTQLNLSDNPLEKPPLEIAEKGMEAIRNYFATVEISKVEKLYESKLIIVGRGAVGKTCLREKLKDHSYNITKNERTTEGVDIVHWKLDKNPLDKNKNFIVHMWDFGGQEVYHATHQFFLTKRSLYIFVWEARRDDDYNDFEYWLNVIKLLSDSSPVIVVMNKCDERTKEIDRASLKNKFPSIIEFFNVSCLKGDRILELTDFVRKSIVKLPLVGTDWPEVWTKIRNELEKDKRDYIDYSEYKIICQNYGLDENQANQLSSYLNDLGIILHFQDDKILRNIVILKPEWGTTAVYKVLDVKKVRENKGRFHFDDLREIWGSTKYPSEKHVALLALMEKFELSFNLLTTKEYIIPELLSQERPDYEWYGDTNLRFEYHYDFLPAGIIARFIVRNHRLIEERMYWKNGVVLSRENTRAIVVQEQLNRKIRIAIRGDNKKDLLAIIRNEFDHIHATLNNPDVKQMVPCICGECKEDEPYFHDYAVLKNFIIKGKKIVQCQKSTEDVFIDALLGEVIKQEELDYMFGKNKVGDINVKHYHFEGDNVHFFEDIEKSKITTKSQKENVIEDGKSKSYRKGLWKWIVPAIILIAGIIGFFNDIRELSEFLYNKIFNSNKQIIEINFKNAEKQILEKDSTTIKK